jgi:hypothetical protein
MSDLGEQCAHDPCQCQAREGSKYCSDYCQTASISARSEYGCQCGHDVCETRSFEPRFRIG